MDYEWQHKQSGGCLQSCHHGEHYLVHFLLLKLIHLTCKLCLFVRHHVIEFHIQLREMQLFHTCNGG